MCENRERLIGYVYGESEPDEKRAIEEHLTSCHVCRQEIRGLRGVRQDLLAWVVPENDSVWRPVAPVPQEPSWRMVPAWAMAAAASLTLVVGAAGGAATYALLPERSPAVAENLMPATASPPPPPAVVPVDTSELEARLLARVRAELDQRVRVAANQPAAEMAPSVSSTELTRRVNMLSSRQDELYDLVLGVANETMGIRSKQTGLEQHNRLLVSYMQGQGADGALGGR